MVLMTSKARSIIDIIERLPILFLSIIFFVAMA